MDATRQILADNLRRVEDRLADACRRAGRARKDVTVIAVTKSVSASVAAVLFELGVQNLGEGRPQELWHKAGTLPAGVRWHLVGHLQRNKIERTLPLVLRIHSVDSVRLLEALETEAPHPIEVFLEMNCSGEASKQGFGSGDLLDLASRLSALRRVRVVGLMTMAAPTENPQEARPTFARLRELRDELCKRVGNVHPLDELSMGMSDDFEVAIEEGATSVRLGTILFTGLPTRDEAP